MLVSSRSLNLFWLKKNLTDGITFVTSDFRRHFIFLYTLLFITSTSCAQDLFTPVLLMFCVFCPSIFHPFDVIESSLI